MVTLPFQMLYQNVTIEFSGSDVILITDFGLEISYNGKWNFFIRLWDVYADQVYGKCITSMHE